jgi:hypothetical protein
MNASLQAQLVDAIRQLQGLTVETVTLAGVNYPCTAATMIGGTLEFFQGGASNMQTVSVCIVQDDLPTEPEVNTPAVFRDLNFRVKSVDDAGIFYQLLLVQEKA